MVNLKRIRMERGLTQAELAEKIGVTQSCVGHWEIGTKLPDGKNLVAVADALGCSIDELLGRAVPA